MTPMLLAGPAGEPVSVDDAKAWLRLDSTSEDGLVAALIVSARQTVEKVTRRALMTQTWRLGMDIWPRQRLFVLPFAPFRSLAGVRVRDAAGNGVTVDPSFYTLDTNPERARIFFADRPPEPGRAIAGIEIDVVAGYGDNATDVPEPLRQAIRVLVAGAYENRGDADNAADMAVSPVAKMLMAQYRRTRLA